MSAPTRTELAGLLTRVERRVARRIEVLLRAEDLTAEQWRVLTVLADDGGRPMTEIAHRAMVPPPTLTKIVDRLIDRTLVHRRIDPADRRRVLVLLAPRGAELVARLDLVIAGTERELAATFGEPELAQLTGLLTRLLDHLD